MKSTYKILFWITLTILVLSNTFWIYQAIDNAVGHSYYKVSCDEYYQDMLRFKQILDAKTTKMEAINFLKKNKVEFASFQKGAEFIITFDSFALEYDTDGRLISSTNKTKSE